MLVKTKNNKIYIKDQEIAFLNANINNDTTICIELLKVKREFRNQNYAKKILLKAIEYFKTLGFKIIKLTALPLDTRGLDLQALKNFYKKFNFLELDNSSNEMVKYL